jgi:hypothetical protein
MRGNEKKSHPFDVGSSDRFAAAAAVVVVAAITVCAPAEEKGGRRTGIDVIYCHPLVPSNLH